MSDYIEIGRITRPFWDALNARIQAFSKQDKSIAFSNDSYASFHEYAEELYNEIKDKYMAKGHIEKGMNSSDIFLDRHKVAAVLIVAALETAVVSYNKNLSDGRQFLGCEMFVTEIAWSWMVEKLNKEFSDKHIDIKIDKLTMPRAFSCNTPYFDIFCRELFYAKTSGKLFALDIADRLFLLEYITLIDKGIDLTLLSYYKEE